MDNNMNGQGYQNDGQYRGQGIPPLKPNSNLILAIFTTICCCLPLGIVGIVYATKVDSLYNTGQYMAAQQAANDAKKWSLIGIAIGAIGSIIYGILVSIYGFAMFSQM